MKKVIIAIDGFSGCGKSSTAKAVAAHLGYNYIDTGAMYRAVTLYFLEQQVAIEQAEAVAAALAEIVIEFQHLAGKNQVFLNGRNVTDPIRQPAVNAFVSPVATLPAVRRAMVEQQRKMGQEGGLVMDGRDIGTVVFPEAALKLFVTAGIEERVARRYAEMRTDSALAPDYEAIRSNLLERDRIDSSRADSPLQQAEDAILIDNSQLSFDDFLAQGLALAKAAIAAQAH